MQGAGRSRLAVCRFHGARGGGPEGKHNGRYWRGFYTNEAKEGLRLLLNLLKQSRAAKIA
jgi:hypothetical protein